ncbi:MAG: O-antigen ligase family protein [Patescibacteria group bacterium]
MSLTSPKISLAILLGGSLIVLLLGVLTDQSIATSLVMLAGLITAVVFLNNSTWGLSLVILIRPSIDKFSEQFSVDLGRNFTFNAAAVFGILVVFLLTLFLFKNRRGFSDLPLKKLWLLFLGIALLSIAISIDRLASIYGMIKILSIFLIFASAYLIVKKENNAKTVLYAIIFSSLIPFIFASFQLITGSGVGGSEGIESRLFGTFSHPNPFASFVLIVVSVALFLFLKENRYQIKWILGILFFGGIIILEQTYARGAWLAFLIFLLILTYKKSFRLLIGICLASILLFFFSSSIQNRVQDVYNPPADSSVRWRFKQWERMYGAFIKKPLTGYGIGTETVVHEREFGPNAGNQYTHNDFLRIALETGVFGFTAYSLLLLFTFIELIKNYAKEKSPFAKDLGLFVLALYLGLLSYSLTNNNLNETVTQWTMWGIIGASLALQRKTSSEESKI